VEAEQWFPGKKIEGVYLFADIQWEEPTPRIKTLEGISKVSPGDWIITGVNGEKYPCKSDIFEKTYEPVGDDPHAK
jgi:hypothetical protein